MFSNPGWLNDIFRSFFTALDNFGYFFVNGVFSIFFTIVNADIFSGVVINTFYERIQLILGIIMIFKLSFTLLQIIVNPDMFKDKQKGAGSIVMRVAVVLVLFIVAIKSIYFKLSNTYEFEVILDPCSIRTALPSVFLSLLEIPNAETFNSPSAWSLFI